MHQGDLAGTHWDPSQYLKFADHRLRPALELLNRINLAAPATIYDLGCGAGNITRMIAERWPTATVYGVDNSPEMLEQAATESASIQWHRADIECWQPEAPSDLIFSNATLHWLTGHRELFPRLASFLKPGGVLAVQMPLSWDTPSHRLMRATLAGGGGDGRSFGTAELRQAMAYNWVEPAEVYYDLLAGVTSSLDIWATEYLQVLEGSDPVLEWVKGTGLRPILNALDAREREHFLTIYAQQLREAYPTHVNGRTLYPFRRLFIVAMM
jgi:trans-aconitate 2-methyltransferase